MTIQFPMVDFMSQMTRNWDKKATFTDAGINPFVCAGEEITIDVWQVILKRSRFSNHDLAGMFKYHKLTWSEWIMEWECKHLSNRNIEIILFIRKEK